MGKPTGFVELSRRGAEKRPIDERTRDHAELVVPLTPAQARDQAARCMDCGVPFCHQGCPLGNVIPDFNELVHRGSWRAAHEVLASTNNFPEFTGRLCPAPCEAACVLAIEPRSGPHTPPDAPRITGASQAVTIELIEKTIIERAFDEGWVRPHQIATATGKRIAVVGSGPAGLAAAEQLARAGHAVTVFEKSDRTGGLLRYGIPDF
ncbi:MAG: NAD(P)-binding protein, partial [Polyangia bacterium]